MIDRDTKLAEVIAALIAQQQRGVRVDIDQAARAHPEIADELRSLWNVAAMADFLGEAVDSQEWRTSTLSQRVGVDGDTQSEFGPPGTTGTSFGDYELLERVGEGGMGVVFRARQKSLGRIVALKVIQKGALASANELARFRAEASASAHLDHPQVIPIYEVGELQGQPYFTMKYVQGTTLAARLAAGPLPAWEAAALLRGVARAVAYAHANGIVHRDLKPSNILIDTEGRAHVGDFGLAKRIEVPAPAVESRLESVATQPLAPSPQALRELTRELESDSPLTGLMTRTGVILGTPSYMSPEQASGRRSLVGPSSDIYSLGVILYQCMTGRPPFQAASPVDLIMMVLEQEPVPPRMLNPAADPELEMIALKCLQKPIELRYRSATELANDLDAYLSNEPVSARSTHITQLVSRLFRETHHAVVLENWGLLWMLHSLVLLVLCTMTNWFQWRDVTSRVPYLGLWVVGLGAWAMIFWTLRRRAGPITFVERQIAHIWGGSMLASSLLFAVETLLGMPVLNLSPVLPLIGATVFVVKAGTLSGAFYAQAVALFATALAMGAIRHAGWFDMGLTLYGIVSALCFFIPGYKYWRQSRCSRLKDPALRMPRGR